MFSFIFAGMEEKVSTFILLELITVRRQVMITLLYFNVEFWSVGPLWFVHLHY